MNSLDVNAPQLNVDIDRTQVKSQGVRLADVFESLRSTSVRCTSRLQPVRPHLQGDCPGRCGPPYAGEAIGPPAGAQRGGDMLRYRRLSPSHRVRAPIG